MKKLAEIRDVPLGKVVRIGRREGVLRHWRTEALPVRRDSSIVDERVGDSYYVRYEILLNDDLFFAYGSEEFCLVGDEDAPTDS